MVSRLLSALPDLDAVVRLGPLFLLFTLVVGRLAGWLRRARGVRAPFTRKVFHFGIFSLASWVHLGWGLPETVLFGCVVALVVLVAVARGRKSLLFQALARPSDEPHPKLFILAPLASTALGGVLASLLFGPFAAVGYLVAGWGDAAGEPVGTAWGRHPYRIPSLAGVEVTRTLEGSLAVAVCGALAGTLALTALGQPPGMAWLVGTLCGIGSAVVEAFSHHGLDNLTVQLAAAGIAYALLA